MSTVRLPNPKGLEFVYHGDHIEVIRTDGKTPTLRDMKVRDAWFDYLKKKADNLRHCPVLSLTRVYDRFAGRCLFKTKDYEKDKHL